MARHEHSISRRMPEWTMRVTLPTGERFYRLTDERLVDDDLELILPTTHPDVWDAFAPNVRAIPRGTRPDVDAMLDAFNGLV